MLEKANTNRDFYLMRSIFIGNGNTKTHEQIAREEQQRLRLRTHKLLNKGLSGIIEALDEWINELEILFKGKKNIDLIKDQRNKGIKLSPKDIEFERSYYQTLRNKEELSRHLPYPFYWRLSLFVSSIEKLYIALRRKNMPYAAEDIEKKFLSMLHALGPKDDKNPPKTNCTIQEIEDIISAIEWSKPAPRNKDRSEYRMEILESLSNKICMRTLKDFRDMVAKAIDEIQRKEQTGTQENDGKGEKKRGRNIKHSEDKLKAAEKLFDKLRGEGKSVSECWYEVHDSLGFTSPNAAKQAVYRFKKQNKKQK